MAENGMCINVYGYYDPSKYIWEIKMNDVWYAAVSVSKSFFKKKLQMKLTVAPYSKPRVLDVIKQIFHTDEKRKTTEPS